MPTFPSDLGSLAAHSTESYPSLISYLNGSQKPGE